MMPSWTPAAASLVPGLIAASLVSLAFAKPGKMKFWLLAIVPIASALAAAGFVGLEASRRFLFIHSGDGKEKTSCLGQPGWKN